MNDETTKRGISQVYKHESVNFTKISWDVDRADWSKGDWDNEPDLLEWKSWGNLCRIVRQSTGYLCGYVLLTKKHLLFRRHSLVSHGSCSFDSFEVHGGITYTSFLTMQDVYNDLFAVGFDCAHRDDDNAKKERYGFMGEGYYKDIPYVINEVISLSEQLCKFNQSNGGKYERPSNS